MRSAATRRATDGVLAVNLGNPADGQSEPRVSPDSTVLQLEQAHTSY